MKYPPLEPPCKDCLGCMRLEDPTFISDKNCRYAKKHETKEINWKQEELWKIK